MKYLVVFVSVNMESFESFEVIFDFYVRQIFDSIYVQQLDEKIKSDTASKEENNTVIQVSEFHKSRANLYRKLKIDSSLLNNMSVSYIIEQYLSVADKSVCFISNEVLHSKTGYTYTLKSPNDIFMYTTHRRFKPYVYNLWFLIHMDQEVTKIIHEAMDKHSLNLFSQIKAWHDNAIAKQCYLKIRNCVQFLQKVENP